MNRKELFDHMKRLIGYLDQFKKKGTVNLGTQEELMMLQKVYTTINPGVQMDLYCDTCKMHYLHMLLAYYEREYPKYLQSLPQETPIAAPVTSQSIIVSEPAVKTKASKENRSQRRNK